MARSEERRPWLRHFKVLQEVEEHRETKGLLLIPLREELMDLPSFSAESITEAGTKERHRRSPIKWSSQMLSEKESIPGEREEILTVRASRCERRNMLDFPTIQGATATAEIAV